MVIYGGRDRLSTRQDFCCLPSTSMFAACWGRSVNRSWMWCEHTERGAHRGRRDKDMKRTQTSREAQLEGDGSTGRLICRFSPESRANNSCCCLISTLCSHKKTVLCFMKGDKNLSGLPKRCRVETLLRGEWEKNLEGAKFYCLGARSKIHFVFCFLQIHFVRNTHCWALV